MRIVKEEPDDPHTNLKKLAPESDDDVYTESDVNSLLDDIDVIEE